MSAGAGLVFHGTGFYITDYGKDGKKDQRGLGDKHPDHPHHRTSENHTGSGDTGESASAPASASTNGKPRSDSVGSNGAEPKASTDSSKDTSKDTSKAAGKSAAKAAASAKASE